MIASPARWPINIAHRGASARAPENTLDAFRLALEDGADGLELDVHLSADEEVIVLHDRELNRTTDGTGPARELTLRELRQLDAGHRFLDHKGDHSWRGRDSRIPTLDELLSLDPTPWLSIDLKEGDPVTERRCIELIRDHRATRRVALGAENSAAARRLRELAPEIPSFFSRDDVRSYAIRSASRFWAGYRPPGSSLQLPRSYGLFRFDRASWIARAKSFGVRVFFWTVDDSASMQLLLDRGADGIITNRPDRLSEILRARRTR